MLNIIYDQKNRVEISLNKKQLKEIAKKLQISEIQLGKLINKILTTTHNSTMKDLHSWIDENIPLLTWKDLSKGGLSLIFEINGMDLIDKKDSKEVVKESALKEILDRSSDEKDSSISFEMENQLRDNIKLNLASSKVKEGRFYRIRFGTALHHDIIQPLNEDKKSKYYHFIERMIEFAYNQTLDHLEDNYNKYCPNLEIHNYLKNKLDVICKRKWKDEDDNTEIENVKEYIGLLEELLGLLTDAVSLGIKDSTIKKELDPLQTVMFLGAAIEAIAYVSPEYQLLLEMNDMTAEEYLQHSINVLLRGIAGEK